MGDQPTVLALDTAGHACSVALVRGQETLFNQTKWMSRGHASALAPLVYEALSTLSPVPHVSPAIDALNDTLIGAIVVTRGPGGFTGMRVGLAFARAFALARNIPCYGLSVFQALRLTQGPSVPCALDSRRGDFFFETHAGAEVVLLGGDEALNLAGVSEDGGLGGLPVAGSLWQTLPPVVGRFETVGFSEPCPEAMAHFALRKLQAAAPKDADLSPLYFRAPAVAKPKQ